MTPDYRQVHAMKLRLLLFTECNRQCKGCCNKDWNLDALPVCNSFSGYKNIMLTGGEPMLQPELVKEVAGRIREETEAQIFLYTAKTDDIDGLLEILRIVDGVTVTLHTRKDAPLFRDFNDSLRRSDITGKSLRLNVFDGISVGDTDVSGWLVKSGIRWIKDCPLPANEVFMRWNVTSSKN